MIRRIFLHRRYAAVIVTTVLAPVAACDGAGGSAPRPAVGIVAVAPSSLNLEIGSTGQMVATVVATNGATLTDRTVKWSSEKPLIATVSQAGVVTAVGAGATTIFAQAEAFIGAGVAIVTAPPVANIAISPTALNLTVGGSGTLTATLTSASGAVLTGRTVVWTSSANNVATASSSGVVTAAAAGTATITATSGAASRSVQVTVIAGALH